MTKTEAIEALSALRVPDASDLNDAARLAIDALRFQQAVEVNLKALSVDELVSMGSSPVWIVEGTDSGHWELSVDGWDYLEGREPALYGVSWWAYRQKKEKSDG